MRAGRAGRDAEAVERGAQGRPRRVAFPSLHSREIQAATSPRVMLPRTIATVPNKGNELPILTKRTGRKGIREVYGTRSPTNLG